MKPAVYMKTKKEHRALATALGFARGVLQIETYGWLEKILLDLDAPGKVAIKAANGTGKTSRIAAPAALWNAAVHPGSITLCSAGVYRQVGELFHAVQSHRHRFPKWEFLNDEVRAHNGSRIIGFSADRPELFEGFHSPHLLIVLDECKSIVSGVSYSLQYCCRKMSALYAFE